MRLKFRKKIENIKKKPLVIQYDPPEGLDSAEVGLLLYRRSDPMSIISLIYKWIGAGLISIDESSDKTHYVINKVKEISDMAPSHEFLFWKSLFNYGNSIKIDENSDLSLEESLKALEERGYKKGWFVKNDSFNNGSLVIMGIIIILIILLFITPHNAEKDQLMTAIISVLCFVLFLFPKLGIIVGVEMPKFKEMKLTEKGNNLVHHILGFKKFLETCDTNVLKTFLKKDPLYFDKILPYAIVFGVESELIERIHPIIDELGLILHIYQFNNHFYGVFHDIADQSIPTEIWSPPSIPDNGDSSYDSDRGFKSGSSSSRGGGGFSSGGGGGGGGSRSW